MVAPVFHRIVILWQKKVAEKCVSLLSAICDNSYQIKNLTVKIKNLTGKARISPMISFASYNINFQMKYNKIC